MSQPLSRSPKAFRPTAPADATLSRTRDAIPGALAWLALAAVVGLAAGAPDALLGIIALLAAYLATRLGAAGIAVARGLWLVHRWQSRDWPACHRATSAPGGLAPAEVRHLVIIPAFQEDPAVLRRTLDRLAQQAGARDHAAVILALEGAEAGARAKGEALQAAYARQFARVVVTLHPANRPGEVQCKSANLRWALQQARTPILHDLRWDAGAVLVTTMDADTIWHPQHFAALSCMFAGDPQRHCAFYQAPMRYHANVWNTHPMLRILHAYASAWELAYLAAPWWRALPMSSYALSLRALDRADGWDGDAVADDWHMFIKAFFTSGGQSAVRPIYLPFLATAPPHTTLGASIRARYWQTFRHAWGAREIGYTLSQIHATSYQTPRSAGLLLRVAHDNLLAGAGWILLVLGPQLLTLLHPGWLRTQLDTPAMFVLQVAWVLVAALTTISWIVDIRLRPARTAPPRRREFLWELASLPLLALLTLACVALPALHAQTTLLLGKPLRIRVTAKS